MTGLDLRQVTKRFGDSAVLHGIDLTVEPGEFCVFVGPSGCGKSTLLRLVAGLEDASSGSIHIGARDVTRVDAGRRGVAMVFQSYALYPHLSVAENMGYSLRIAGRPRAEIRAAVEEVARMLGLDALLERKPRALSGGQRQRVAIGRAILRRPDLFLFDEPLSNLDAELRGTMRVEIARLHRQLGTTMIYVTHDQVEAMTLADRLVLMRGGRIEQQGRPLDLYEDPDTRFVAGFLGSPRMNFLAARLQAVEGARVTVASDDLAAPLALTLNQAPPAPGAPVELGIRPDALRIDPQGEIALTLHMVENLGSERLLHGRTPGGAAITVTCPGRDHRDLRAGDPIRVSVTPGRAMLFSESGMRLR